MGSVPLKPHSSRNTFLSSGSLADYPGVRGPSRLLPRRQEQLALPPRYPPLSVGPSVAMWQSSEPRDSPEQPQYSESPSTDCVASRFNDRFRKLVPNSFQSADPILRTVDGQLGIGPRAVSMSEHAPQADVLRDDVIFQRFSLVCIPNEHILLVRDVEAQLKPANSGTRTHGLALTRNLCFNRSRLGWSEAPIAFLASPDNRGSWLHPPSRRCISFHA